MLRGAAAGGYVAAALTRRHAVGKAQGMAAGGETIADIDVGVLGRTMLEAARAAHIGVTLTVFEPRLRCVYVSEAVAEMLGWSVEELLARDPLDIVAPDEVPRLRERARLRAAGELGQASYKVAAVRKDGQRLTIEVTTSDVVVSGRTAVFAFLVDVTARNAAEQARLRTEARFRELIESAPEPIGITRAGRHVYANRACVATLGFESAEALYATPIATLLEPDGVAIRDAREQRVLGGAADLPAQVYRVRRPDGSVILVEISSVPFEYEGQPSMLSIGRDITARKRLESQLVQADRLAALGTMAAGMAHEINNPLAYLMLNLEWIARKLPDAAGNPAGVERLLEVLAEARQGAQRVSAIVRQLASFSRADGETRHHVDLVAVVQSAIKMTGHEVRHRARVTTSFESVRPVWANEARLEQVVVNLLMNASQALPETRAASNEVRIVVRPGADRRAILEVSDNGEGIPADVLPRIFDPFFTTKPVGVGTGLGLSICHGIVASLGGDIAAFSEPGHGTTFRVVLPTVEPGQDDVPASSEVPSPAATPRARILVVDDEPAIAHTLRELFREAHDVAVATSGHDALELLRSGATFDVIFCDLMMPGTSGIDVYERLRVERPGLEQRIVFVTGGAFTPRAAAFLASVDNRRLDKPFSLDVVDRIMRETVAGRGGDAHGSELASGG
ncbi:MAG TPA: PAS domain S-box protein [Polyangiaceae bacterium]|nr:PAS domain S-box protein [Polyangiaceae bacterium]